MKKINFWKILIGWCIVLTVVLGIGLGFFYNFLKNYQKEYEATRPHFLMDEVITVFSEENIDELFEMVETVEVDEYEVGDTLLPTLKKYLAAEEVSYCEKEGEYFEERPVYLVKIKEEPFAVVRIVKQEETARFGLPKWQLGNVEILLSSNEDMCIYVPDTITVTINGKSVDSQPLMEEGIEEDYVTYMGGYAEVPAMKKYSLAGTYGELDMVATNIFGESAEIIFNEEDNSYHVAFGTSADLTQEVQEYVVQFVKDYAMYCSNDAGYSSLDKYFPKGSALLDGIKSNRRDWYDYHHRPEIKNDKLVSLTAYTQEAFSARVYLEQYMYVPYSGKTEIVVTDIEVFFAKIEGKWKVAGIAFE